MAIRSLAAILTVDADRPFPNLVGTGALITTQSVLVHPPFSLELATGLRPELLRVCLTTWAGEQPTCETIDVAEVVVGEIRPDSVDAEAQLATTARRQPVVELKLATPTTIVPDPPLDSYESLLRLLADPFNGPATDDGGDHAPNVFCKLLGIFC